MLQNINKIKPELKFKFVKKFQKDLVYSFLFKRNKISNKKLLNWSTYNLLNNLQKAKSNIYFSNREEYFFINQDFEYIKEKSRIFNKKLSIYYLFCKILQNNNKKKTLNFKNLKPLITSILLKSFLLTIKKKLGKNILLKIISNFKYYNFLIKNLKNKKKKFDSNFFFLFFKFFYNIKVFFLYKSLFFVINKKRYFFKKKYLTAKRWFYILNFKYFDETLNYIKILKTKNMQKKFRFKFEKKIYFILRFKLKKKKSQNKIYFLKRYIDLKNIDLSYFLQYKNLNYFLKNNYINLYFFKKKKNLKKNFKKFPIIQSLLTLKFINKSIFLIKKYKFILKKSLILNILDKNSDLYLKIFQIYLKNLKFLFLILNDFKIRSKFLKILDFGKYKKKIKIKQYISRFKKRNRRFAYFTQRICKRKKKKFKNIYNKLSELKSEKKINIFEKQLQKSKNLDYVKDSKFSDIFIIRKKIKKYTKNSYLIYNKISTFKNKMIYLQKLSFFLGKMKKKYIKKYIKESLISKNNSVNIFLNSLESRIDVILFRLGFFRSFGEIKMFIKEGNILLNENNVLKNCSVRLKNNDIFKINNKEKIMFKVLKDSQFFLSSIFQIPEYIEFNFYIFSGIFLENLLNINKVYYPISIRKKNLNLKNPEIFRDILK